MPSAIFRFFDLPIPDLNIHISGYGEPDRVRRFLRAATHRRHMLLRADIEQYVVHVICEMRKHTTVKITPHSYFADLTYSFDRDERGIPQLRIVRQEPAVFKNGQHKGKRYVKHTMLYHGGFFKWLRNRDTLPGRRVGRPKGTTKAVLLAREQQRRADYLEQHEQGKHYTPLQMRLRKQHESLLKESAHKSEGAKRRHETKRLAAKNKMTLAEWDAMHAPQKKYRKVKVDFSGISSVDPGYDPRNEE